MVNKTCPSCGFGLNLDTDAHCGKCGSPLAAQPVQQQANTFPQAGGAQPSQNDSQIVQYIKQCRQTGMTDPVIRQRLIDAGWPQVDIDNALVGKPVAPQPETKKTKLKYSSRAIGAVNLLVFGLGYLFLHMYGRFIVVGLLFTVGYIVSNGYIILPAYGLVIYDCIRLTHKIENGEKELPEKSTVKLILCILFIFFSIALLIAASFMRAMINTPISGLY